MRLLGFFRSQAFVQGVIVLVDQGLMSLVTFGTGLLIARSSSKEEYAIYMLGWSAVFTLKGLHESLVNLPVTVYLPRKKEKERLFFWGSGLLMTLVFVVVCAGLVAAFQNLPTSNNLEGVKEYSWILLLLLSSFVLKDFVRNLLLASLDVYSSVKANSVVSIVIVLAISSLYYAGMLGPLSAYVIFSVGYAVAFLLMVLPRLGCFRFSSSYLVTHIFESWKISKWAIVGTIGYMASRMSFPWLLLHYSDLDSVATYSACLALALAPSPLLRGAGAYILPRMTHGLDKNGARDLGRILKKAILILSPIYLFWLLVSVIFPDKLLEITYPGMFEGASVLYIMLVATVVMDFIFAPLANALQALERTKDITISLLIGAASTLALSPLFIGSWGMVGAGYLSLISMVLTLSWRMFVLRSYFFSRVSDGR